eukprot:2457545-Amphidinium_carterae.1
MAQGLAPLALAVHAGHASAIDEIIKVTAMQLHFLRSANLSSLVCSCDLSHFALPLASMPFAVAWVLPSNACSSLCGLNGVLTIL